MVTTRERLIEAANRAFAEQGIWSASLVEVTRQAGQRNRGAVHYHFGGREELLIAVMEQHVAFLAQREGELLAVAQERPDDDLASVVEAVVRPVVELAETGESGRNYLVIVGEVIERDPATLHQGVADVLARTGGRAVYALMAERMPEMSDELRGERFALVTAFMLGAAARRARAAADEAPGGRPQLATDDFIANLMAMAAAMLAAPTIDLTQ
jgi:AcrR family transcriptional regulator